MDGQSCAFLNSRPRLYPFYTTGGVPSQSSQFHNYVSWRLATTTNISRCWKLPSFGREDRIGWHSQHISDVNSQLMRLLRVSDHRLMFPNWLQHFVARSGGLSFKSQAPVCSVISSISTLAQSILNILQRMEAFTQIACSTRLYCYSWNLQEQDSARHAQF